MGSARKRGRQEMEANDIPKEPSMTDRLRNMWEFANLAQWIFIFGRAVKIDENFGIEELEMECLKSQSTILPEIGLALLKFVSSHRGLTPEIFDEYTRRQYVTRTPGRNPFGIEEEPSKFTEFDVFTKIRVLQQLTQWTMINSERIRERMEESKDTEQTSWRIEPCGWDEDDREYFVLDDNRLYRRTEPPPPAPPAPKYKKNSKKGKAAARASKRRKTAEGGESEAEPEEGLADDKPDDGFGGAKWECIAVTLDEFTGFAASLEKSRDPNEKILRKRIVEQVLPVLEKQEEARKRKEAQKERELINIEKLATAKRSSRIAGKMEQQKQEEEAKEAELKRQAELKMAKKEQQKWLKLEKERESRMMTREQRVKEREARRILHEEELANLSEDSKKFGSGEGRLSERHLKAEIERKKQALEELAEEEDWIFDCICGAYGQIDDGTHSIACEKCNIWQHSKCVGVSEAEADHDDFHFICSTCKRRAEDAETAKTRPPIKIKLNRPGSSSSPNTPKENGLSTSAVQNGNTSPGLTSSPQKPMPKMHLFSTIQKTTQSAPGSSPPLNLINDQEVPVLQPQLAGTEDQLDEQPPSSPAAKSEFKPYGRTGGSPSLPRHNGLSNTNPFSSPLPHSPTSLPPPRQSNTNGSQHNHSPSKPQSSPTSSPIAQNADLPLFKSYGEVPIQPLNGLHRENNDARDRRSSFNFPSPLAGVPVLTPSQKNHPLPNSLFENNATPSRLNATSASSPTIDQDTGHASALPSAVSGISPTKHSPPRPSSNGSATPSILPPVGPMSPSPQSQNLTPPTKQPEPEIHSLVQSIGP